MTSSRPDVSSLSNRLAVVTAHIHLDWFIDFAKEQINGCATLELLVADASHGVTLDAKGLCIDKVEISTVDSADSYKPVPFATSTYATPALGEGLTFNVPPDHSRVFVKVHYKTDPSQCLALCWLSPEQTESRKLPFLYSQCQAIHARTLLPCQDSPGIRATYSANVSTSVEEAVVLMSATQQSRNDRGAFSFRQPKPIPSYLIAIAAGNIDGRDVSPRCRVYAEPTSLERAANEFTDVERFVEVAEMLAGPYEWGRYDLIVLPPSFPFGGMENPNLTFVTPTCITGDRSLVELVAHEVCHSWSGNLVGIASWEHFWINEGFTTFLQRKISERLHGKDVADFEAATGMAHLNASVKLYGETHNYTRLVPELRGEDPDDAFSSIPYEKGYALLRKLEALVGSREMEAWIRDTYIPSFRERAVDSTDVQKCFTASFPHVTIDWEREFRNPGMPLETPPLSNVIRDESNAIADRIIALDRGTAADPEKDFWPSTMQKTSTWQGRQHIALLERIEYHLERSEPNSLSTGTLTTLDSTLSYSSSLNYEVLALWFGVCLRSRGAYTGHMPRMQSFLSSVGRMKFLRPLYRAWAAFDYPAAWDFFERSAPRYHAITRTMANQDFAAAKRTNAKQL